MAKGKKSSGKVYVSKGERPSVNKGVLKAIKRERSPMTDLLNKLDAYNKGHPRPKGFESMPDPRKNRFIMSKFDDVE